MAKTPAQIIQFLLLLLLPLSAFSSAFERIDNFALLDQAGIQHELRKYGDSKAVVIFSAAASCDKNIDQLSNFQLLRTTWERRGFVFLGLDSSALDRLADVQLMDQLYNWDMPILLDDSQLVAENLGISYAGELLIVDPRRSLVLYRGSPRSSFDSKHFEPSLIDVLEAANESDFESLHGTVREAKTGCELTFPAREKHRKAVPDYSQVIAPIIKNKCAGCHVEGGIAPFALSSHTMVQGWSPMMREVLMTKRMPPAQVDPSIKHFENANYISAQEMQLLIHWIEAGSPRGKGAEDPLENLSIKDTQWQLGEPDYIVEVPPIRVPATGVLDYENVTINLPFERDVWVKAVQHLPGDRRVLHHLLSFVVPADYDARIVEGENDEYREFLEGYAPGKEGASRFPDQSGVLIPAKSAIQMSLHYTTFGKAVTDKTKIGLYFAQESPKHHYSTYSLSVGGENIEIPAGVRDHKMSASHVFEEAIVLHGLRPHMHYRGKQMRMSVVYPTGTLESIINVPNYSFAWQPTYRLSEPMVLPAGSRVIIEGVFDNSEYNLGNPDPGAPVRGGAQSWDEMFIGYFSYHKATNN